MKINLVVVESINGVTVHLGTQAMEDERLLESHELSVEESSGGRALAAFAEMATDESSIGRRLEELLQHVYQLGRQRP